MSELVEFLLQRIAEDEAIARAVVEDDGGETGGMEDSFDQLTGRADWFGEPVLPKYGDPLAALIVHTAVPARVLCECEAKRRIVQGAYLMGGGGSDSALDHEVTLAHLATVYADHPDYREEWKP